MAKVLCKENISYNILKAEYAVRGKIVEEANRIEEELKKPENSGKYPFTEIIYANIGNPQRLQQKPITFLRQILACVEYPELLNHPELMPSDVIARAKAFIQSTSCVGATGAYTHSKGLMYVRKSVCRFIEARDGYACDPESVFVTDGASVGIKLLLNMIIQHPRVGVMIPIPQYPLYSATICMLGGVQIGYYLNEKKNWCLEFEELQARYHKATAQGVDVRAICVINPGNPTGEIFSRKNVEDILRFAAKNRIVVFADEVYQENIYGSTPFVSFRKVMKELNLDVELASFHSVSKGYFGECGKRGGYMQLENIDPYVLKELYKVSSVNLCSNAVGQLAVEVMVNLPKPGDPSYDLFDKERTDILSSLKIRANLVRDALLKLEGYSCTVCNGSLYLYPQLRFPQKFLDYAASVNEKPDDFYCMRLVKETGICVVPGSGFGQEKRTFHFRVAFLPQLNQMDSFVKGITAFHTKFMAEYAS